jgi:hypothetical protein
MKIVRSICATDFNGQLLSGISGHFLWSRVRHGWNKPMRNERQQPR